MARVVSWKLFYDSGRHYFHWYYMIMMMKMMMAGVIRVTDAATRAALHVARVPYKRPRRRRRHHFCFLIFDLLLLSRDQLPYMTACCNVAIRVVDCTVKIRAHERAQQITHVNLQMR